MSTFVYAANEAEMTIKPEEDKITNLVNIENIETDIGINQVPTVKAYGTTLVNLLGKYGNFETDTNADGLADGWINYNSLVICTLNSGVQTAEISEGQTAVYLAANNNVDFLVVGHTYFISTLAQNIDLTNGIAWWNGAGSRISTEYNGTSLHKVSAIYNAVATKLMIRFRGTAGQKGKISKTQVIDLTERGALDPVRAAKYGVSNWSDLTEAQLEAEIPYFDSVLSVNVEDGTVSELTVENRGKNLLSGSPFTKALTTDTFEDLETIQLESGTEYVLSTDLDDVTFNVLNSITKAQLTLASNSFTAPDEAVKIQIKTSQASDSYTFNVQLEEATTATAYTAPRTDSITIPDTVELHGYNGVFNTIDSNGNYIKNWERENKTTDVSGAFSLTGYATGSKVICRNKTNGEVEVLDAAASVTTSWTQTEIEILYRLATAVESTVQLESTGFMLYPGDNNVLSSNSKAPVAIQVSNYTDVSSTSSTQAFIERFRAATKRGGRTFQPYGSRTLKSVPTSEEVAISLSKMNIDDEAIGLALADGHFQIENSYTNANDGSTITDTYQHCRITSHGKEYSAGDIVKEDVEIECAKVVTS